MVNRSSRESDIIMMPPNPMHLSGSGRTVTPPGRIWPPEAIVLVAENLDGDVFYFVYHTLSGYNLYENRSFLVVPRFGWLRHISFSALLC